MSYRLLIVESPNKIAKLSSILGKGWKILPTMGHIEDLPVGIHNNKLLTPNGIVAIPAEQMKRVRFGIDVARGFKPLYTVISNKETVIEQILAAGKEAREIYIATDPDREGEAIAHSVRKLIPSGVRLWRLNIRAIAPREVARAVAQKGEIDNGLVVAAHARRVIDRLIGYFLSPLAEDALKAKKVTGGSSVKISVGRVQSPSLAIVSESLSDREKFVPRVEYRLRAIYDLFGTVGAASFWMRGHSANAYYTKETARNAQMLASGGHKVKGIARSKVKFSPPPPLKTSTMQTSAFRRYGMGASQSMSTAQALFQKGFCSYPRTDSLRLSHESTEKALAYVKHTFGPEYICERNFIERGEFAQDAHEAIHPVGPHPDPGALTPAMHQLYELISERYLASQMADAEAEEVVVELETLMGKNLFEARYRHLSTEGYTKLVAEDQRLLSGGYALPPWLDRLTIGSLISRVTIEIKESTPSPPPPIDEATLIEAVEREGIGRPSTYAEISLKLKERGYIENQEGPMGPELTMSPRGEALLDYLAEKHPWLVDRKFTAKIEEMLDNIAMGEEAYETVVGIVWEKLKETVPNIGSHGFGADLLYVPELGI